MKLGRIVSSMGDAVSAAAFLGTVTATAVVYPQLPDRIATHFDLHGRADGWMGRAAGAAVLPALALFTWAIVRFGAHLVPKDGWRERLAKSPVAAVAAVTMVALCAVHLAVLRFALPGGGSFDVARATLVVLGTMWIALGVLFPRVRRNPFIGIRTAWTLVSDENWARTHRVASYASVVGGLVALLAAATGGPQAFAAGMIAFIASALVPVVYSWVLARRTA